MESEMCYVVNSVSETSAPATIATAVYDYKSIKVDILAWFDADPFDAADRITVDCLNAPRSKQCLTRAIYRKGRNILQEYDLIQAHQTESLSYTCCQGCRCPETIGSAAQSRHRRRRATPVRD